VGQTKDKNFISTDFSVNLKNGVCQQWQTPFFALYKAFHAMSFVFQVSPHASQRRAEF
jgi:hypothetical protein